MRGANAVLVYIWMCVMLQAFAPGGDSLAARYVDGVQSYMRAQMETIDAVVAPVPPTPTQRVPQVRARTALAR